MSLHVDSIRKRYGEKLILSDIFLSCDRGEVVGLLGRNGTGKTTLLKIIFGSLEAENKFVRIGDKVIRKISDGRNLINYLPQKNFLPSHVKIREIIDCFCSSETRSALYDNSAIKVLLDKKPFELSGGERRLVEISLVIFSQAKIVLLDEPFNGVSPVVKEEIKSYIENQKVRKGFVITDHDYSSILDISTKLVLLKDGHTKLVKDREGLVALRYLPKS